MSHETVRTRSTEAASASPVHQRAAIVAAALRLGQQQGWEQLTLRDIARDLQISLADIYHHFPQKDDLVDAWFEQADQHLLSRVPGASWQRLGRAERIEQTIWCWLQALAPYRELTRDMLWYKLEPGHIHLQVAGILRISRTVQWFREAADLKAAHGLRVAQEIALTGVFVTVFVHWLWDRSDEQYRSRRLLQQQLAFGAPLRLWT